MKIGIFTGIFHPESGGPSTYLYHLLPALQARGHEIRLLTYGEKTSETYSYPVTRISRRAPVLSRLWAFTRQALNLARWADTLFVQGYTVPLLAIRPFFRRRIVAKVVSDFSWEYASRHHLTDLSVVDFQSTRHSPRVRLLRAVYTYATSLADTIIVPSDHVARLVRGWGIPAAKVHVIHNAIPTHDLNQADRDTLRRELNLPIKRHLLVSVGRLTPVKGFDVAIRALTDLPECDLVIVGDGEQRAELEALAAAQGERVHFVGRQPHENVLKVIRAADVFVLSSYTEGLSHVLLEALSVGTPVVATAVGGNLEILTDGVNGLLVPPDSPPVLAEVILRIVNDPHLALALAEAGLMRSQDYSWDATVTQTESLLRGIS